MAAYALGRAPYPGVGGYSGECVLFSPVRERLVSVHKTEAENAGRKKTP